MALTELKILEGLQGLPEDDRAAWYKRFPKNYDRTPEQADRVYKNQEFIKRHGRELFDTMTDPEERDTYMYNSIIKNAMQERYGENSSTIVDEFGTPLSIPEAQQYLLENDYETPEETRQRIEQQRKELEQKPFLNAILGASNDKYGGMGEIDYDEMLQQQLRHNSAILEKAFGKQRDAIMARPDVQQYKSSITDALQETTYQSSEGVEQIENIFEEISTKLPIYQAYKDSYQIDNFTLSDKIDFISNVMAIQQAANDNVETNPELAAALSSASMSGLSDDIQHKVYDLTTTGDKWKKAGKMVTTKFVSSALSTITGFHALALSGNDEALKNYLQGLDENGNPLPWYDNIVFTSGMDMYNTFDMREIQKIRANGGISPYALLKDVGHEFDFFTPETFFESAAMLGYAGASIGLDYLMGGAGSIVKMGTKQALKGFNKIGVKNLLNAAKFVDNAAIDLMGDLGRMFVHSNTEATLEAFTVFDEVNTQLLQKWEQESKTPEYLQAKADYVNSKLQQEFPNGTDRFVIIGGDTSIWYSAKELRRQELAEEFDNISKDKALEAATNAYKTQYASMMLKNSVIDATMKTYLFAKPFATKLRLQENGLDLRNKTIIDSNGKSRGRDYGWGDFAYDATKTIAGGGIEEFTDNMTHNGSVELGLNYYNNYLSGIYNGEMLGKTSLMNGALMSYLNGAPESFYDEGAYYEAALGAISPFTNIAISGRGVASMLTKSGREAFKNASTLEKINTFIYNPLLSTVVESQRGFAENKERINTVNDILEKHGEDFKNIATNIGLVEQFYDQRDLGQEVDARDGKFGLAFQHIINMGKLSKAGNDSQIWKDYQEALEKAAKGDISDGTIEAYLAQPSNKPSVTGMSKQEATQQAKEQIQKNAKKLIELTKEYNNTKRAIHNFANGRLSEDAENQLVYQTMLSKEWQERISTMEKVLTGSASVHTSTTLGQLNEYGLETLKGEYQQKASLLSAKGRKAKDSTSRQIFKMKKKYDRLSAALQKNPDGSIGTLLSAEDILNLSPRDRYLMLQNPNFYTEEQVEEIDRAKAILAQKDPQYMNKVRDVFILSERLDQNKQSYQELLKSPEKLMQYQANLLGQALLDATETIKRTKIDEAVLKLKAEASSMDGFIEEAKKYSSEVLDAFSKIQPELSYIIEDIKERNITLEKINATIDNFDISKTHKDSLKSSVATIVAAANTTQEVVEALEDFIDNPGDGSMGSIVMREQVNEILDSVKNFGLIRNTSKVEQRGNQLEKDRKAREAKDRRNEKAKQRRAEAKAKKEEAKAKKEAEEKAKKDAIEKEKAEKEALEQNKETIGKTEYKASEEEYQIKNEEEINLEEEYNPNTEEVVTPESKETPNTVTPEAITDVEEGLPATDNNTYATQLRGNTLTPYNTEQLKDGVLQKKQANTWLADFFKWMENAGIKFQDIVDFELSDIAALNPEVHYLMINPLENSTNDRVLVRTPLLVVEATEDIKKIHKEDRGGIIRANGKEWLVIGMMGYAPDTNEKALWEKTLNKLAARRDSYFKENPTERFTVDTKYTTTIKNIAIGRIIKQLEEESGVTFRTITELLNDPNRNPYGLTWSDLSFAVQMTTGGFDLSRPVNGTIYAPKRTAENAGNVFLMVKANNGGFIPVAIQPTFLFEIKPGSLQDTIHDYFQQLMSTNHKDRLDAISMLKFLLHFDENNNILIGTKDKNTLSIKENGQIVASYNLDSPDLNKAEVFNTLTKARFRIQITKNDLLDIETLKQLDEAGCLTTNAAILATRGSHYTIHASDLNTGKPVDSTPVQSTAGKVIRGSALNATREHSQLLNGQRVVEHEGNWYYPNGQQITNNTELLQIRALEYIKNNDLQIAFVSSDGYNVYIIDDNTVVCVNKSNKVIIAQGQRAKELIEYHKKTQSNEAVIKNMEEIDLGLEEAIEENTQQTISEKKTTSKEKINENKVNTIDNQEKTLEDLQNSKNLLNFANIISNDEYGDYVAESLEQIFTDKGWGEFPDALKDIERALQKHNIPLPASLSKEDIDTWLDLIKNCR